MAVFKNVLRCVTGEAATTTMSGAEEVEIGSPAEYGGRGDTLNPEELFVASINSCLMLVFYHFADKSGVDIESYEAEAEGTVDKTKNGLRFTHVGVRARIKAQGTDTANQIQKVTELAEKYCLVSNSVSCPVDYAVSLVEETV